MDTVILMVSWVPFPWKAVFTKDLKLGFFFTLGFETDFSEQEMLRTGLEASPAKMGLVEVTP